MIARVVVLLAVIAATDSCPPSPVPPSPPTHDAALPPAPIKDASAPVVDAASPKSEPQPEADPAPLDACGRACSVLYSLGCPESAPTPKGVSCADICRSVELFHGLSLRPGAISACSTAACVRKAGVACKL